MAKSPLRKSRKNILTKKTISRSHSKSEQLVWGIHPVLEALQACPQAIRDINVEKGKTGLRLEQILELAQENSIPVTMVSSKNKAGARKIDELPEHEKSQGISARIDLPTLTLEGLLDKLKDVSGPPLLLALDSIQDPHNLGAIIRSAVAAGVNGLILPKDRSAPLTGTVIKISAGSAFHINICKVTNLVSSFKLLKKNGIWIFGTTKDASQPVYDADLTVPACLVIGSEGKGLRPLVAEQCDLHISIPMQSSLDSLNASVAAGIILFEIVRQRRASPS
ncbi:MAG: 23S rRNA (guanosine(2251)-2'-O)-methyltransferase RlmB [Deltaproteobacteria bacterium]|nr:MAG: 23S rRNA (guanosine(2251)-2'-O)-methyltransferase RlmB [Deltaproteobacteria bacterium]